MTVSTAMRSVVEMKTLANDTMPIVGLAQSFRLAAEMKCFKRKSSATNVESFQSDTVGFNMVRLISCLGA
jgi:hypothetical protein